MGWQDYLNEKNKECLRKSKEDGLYSGDYVKSDIRQTPVGPRPTQDRIHCMRCDKLIADRRGTPFHGGVVHTVLSEEDELKAFPDMRKVRIGLRNTRDGMKVMVCKDCAGLVARHEDDDRMLYTVVAGFAIFHDQCQRDSEFIKERIEETEKYEVDRSKC